MSTIQVSWNNLSCEVNQRGFPLFSSTRGSEKIRILQPQNGSISSGSLTAVMGPSGAGKSTLLDCITGRKKQGVSGSIDVTTSIEKKYIRVALVPQTDSLLGHFSVFETLMFASRMKNSPKIDHEYQVQQVILSLNLMDCIHTKISKCSGGQLKRISIGLEIVSFPDILILDEPTSGLDSVNAELVIRLLLDLASKSMMAIVVTIHQPNYLVFSLFTSIYLLSKSGSLIYSGPPGRINEHFKKFGLTVPSCASPGDFALEVATRSEFEEECDDMSDYYNCHVPNEVHVDGLSVTRSGREVFKSSSNESVSKWSQFSLLSKRSIQVSCSRSPRLLSKIILHLIVIIGISDVYKVNPGIEDGCLIVNKSNKSLDEAFHEYQWNIRNEIPDRPLVLIDERVEEVFNGTNFQFSALMYAMLIYAIGSVLVTPFELATVSKEMNNSWYDASTYMISKTLSELPSLIISSILAVFLIFICTDQLVSPLRVILYSITFILLCWTSDSYGTFIGVLIKDVIVATLFTISSLIPSLLFAGFLVRIDDMKWLYRQLSYFSFIRLSFEPVLITMYGFQRCPLIPPEFEIDTMKDIIMRRKLEVTTLAALSSLGLNEKTIYKFGNMIDVEPGCFKSTVDETFRFFNLFNDEVTAAIGDASRASSLGTQSSPIDPSFILSTFNLDESLILPRLATLALLGITFRLLTFSTILWRKRGNR